MENAKFSVIMPCYNSALYINEAIDSVIAQKYQNWELIAVNDGSTDETPTIIRSYSDRDARIKVFSKENGGYSSAVNMGLNHLSGDYFLMMGSDDQLFPNLFETIISEIKCYLPDMIAFRTIQYVDGVSVAVDSNTDFDSKASLYNCLVADYIEKYPDHAKILFVRDTSKCYKTSLLGDLRLFGKYGYDADGIFSALFAHKAKSFMSIPIDGYHWTLRRDSVSATTNLLKNLDRLSNWKQFFEVNGILKKNEVTKYEVIYATHFANLALSTISAIPINDTKSIMLYHRATKCIPGILKRYDIKVGIPKCLHLFLLSKEPRLWIIIQKLRSFAKV